MCWKSEDEKYNDGVPFKLTCRDEEGVIVTLIADNYYGYCKKEVKTQLSYAADGRAGRRGTCRWRDGVCQFQSGEQIQRRQQTLQQPYLRRRRADYASLMHVQPEGYAIDATHPNVVYVSRTCVLPLSLHQRVTRHINSVTHDIPLTPDIFISLRQATKFASKKHPAAPSWRLIGTLLQGAFCHKPLYGQWRREKRNQQVHCRCHLLHGPVFVADAENDLDLVQEIFDRDFSDRLETRRQ